MMKRPVPISGLGHLRVVIDHDVYLGPGRADILERIADTGSISAAGKSMGMSYKRAWGLVQALNDGFGASLVETVRGGTKQGGARLTDLGLAVLNHYRAMEEKTEAAIADDVEALRALKIDIAERK